MTEKKISLFGHDVRKWRVVNTVAETFNTIMGQMVETFQRKKSSTKFHTHSCITPFWTLTVLYIQ